MKKTIYILVASLSLLLGSVLAHASPDQGVLSLKNFDVGESYYPVLAPAITQESEGFMSSHTEKNSVTYYIALELERTMLASNLSSDFGNTVANTSQADIRKDLPYEVGWLN